MSFGKALYRVINFILVAPPKLGPTFLKKLPSVAFLVPKSTPEEDQLVVFHLSIPMGYVE